VSFERTAGSCAKPHAVLSGLKIWVADNHGLASVAITCRAAGTQSDIQKFASVTLNPTLTDLHPWLSSAVPLALNPTLTDLPPWVCSAVPFGIHQKHKSETRLSQYCE
jgi:hypothetical protein